MEKLTTPSSSGSGSSLSSCGSSLSTSVGDGSAAWIVAQSRALIVTCAGRISVAVGLLVLVGWAFDIESLKVVLAGAVAMKVNTAIGFVLLGTALELLTSRPATTWKQYLGRIAATGVLLIGIVTVVEYCTHWSAGIDEFFVEDPADTSPFHGRPAPATILNFCLLGVALLLLRTEQPRRQWIVQAAVLVAFLMSALALVGYVYGVTYGYRPQGSYPFATMALHTAVCFVLVCAGILYSRNDFSLIAPLRSERAGGILSRKILPAAFGVALFLGWLQLQGERQGFYQLEFGLALYSTSMIAAFSILVWWISYALDRTDTQRRRAEVALGKNQAEFAHVQRINTMGELVAGIAHELNQPLSAILNFSQGTVRRLRSGDRETSELIEVAESIAAESTRAAAIIQGLRRYATHGSPQRSPLDMNTIVENAQQILAGEARQRSIVITIQSAPSLPSISADRVQIEQVLINLICNGFDALDSVTGTKSIWIETRSPSAGRVEVAVTDNGKGLPAEHEQRIFEAFFSTKPQGLGIGLAICRSIIVAHEGTIGAKRRPEGGTTFCFSLPAESVNSP